MYAILDIETTGLSPKWERITEIAIFQHDGNKITDEFVTLINPERLITPAITNLTGITNSMVAKAPKFFEIAKKIVEFTQGRIVVGHNINFDYNFIREEFSNLGYEFRRETLCTVKLSKKLVPGKRSYSLGNICIDLKIRNDGRHRAGGDALATVKLFEHLLALEGNNGQAFSEISALPFKDLHPSLKKESLENLPTEAGVYYFFNETDDLIYVGKSNNIRSRVLSHLRGPIGIKSSEMRQQIVTINYDLTGSELVALLKESAEIKKYKPLFNRAQRRNIFNTGVYFHYDKHGYINFVIDKIKKDDIPLSTFSSKLGAKETMERLCEKFALCHKLSGLYDHSGACFHFHIKKCNGACTGLETPDDYNVRACRMIESFEMEHKNTIIIDKGRSNREKSVVRIENGKYLGYGYIDLDCFDGSVESLKDATKLQSDNKDIQQIIRLYLKTHKVEQVLTL